MITKLNLLVAACADIQMRNGEQKPSELLRDIQHNLASMSEMDELVRSVLTPEAESAARDAGQEVDYTPFTDLFNGFTARQKFSLLCAFKHRLNQRTFQTICEGTGLPPFILATIPTANLAKMMGIIADRREAIERGEPVSELTREESKRLFKEAGLEIPGFTDDEEADAEIALGLGGGN